MANFININSRAGADPRVNDICTAHVRQCLKCDQRIDFYNPVPTIDQLIESTILSTKEKDDIKQFCSKQRQLGTDERVIRICVAYAGNLMLQGATVLFDKQHLAKKMGLSYQTLLFLSSDKYKSTVGYMSVTIPKRGGAYREIDAPRSKLKSCQRWILNHILAKIELHEVVHGFKRQRSIITNAEPHIGKELVIKMDLKDFFPTISFSRVLGVFLDLGYAYAVALVLTRLCTYKRRLPQGAPTSPALANLVCRKLDQRLSGLATRMGYSYTRYADDMTFSTATKEAHPDQIIHIVSKIIAEEGFSFSQEKLSIQRKGSRQLITGLIVNKKLNVPRQDRRRLRAIIHNSQVMGLESQNHDNCPYFFERLEGYVAFITGVNKQQGKNLRVELEKLRQS